MISEPQKIHVSGRDGHSVDSMALTKEGISPDLIPSDLNSPNAEPKGQPHLAPGLRLDQEPVDLSNGLNKSESPEAVPEPFSIESLVSKEDGDSGYHLAPADQGASPFHPDSQTNELSTSTAAEDTNHAAEQWNTGEQPLLPSDEWASDSSTKTRQYLLVGFLGFAGIALSAVLFLVFLRWYGSSKVPTQPSVASTDANPGQSQAAESDDLNPEQPTTNESTLIDNTAVDNGDLLLDARPQTSGGEDADLPGPNSELPESSVPPAKTMVSNDRDTSTAKPNRSAPLALPDSLADSPLSGGVAGGDASTSDPVRAAREALPSPLKGYAEVLRYQIQPSLPDVPVTPTAAPLTAEDLGLRIGASDDAIPAIDWQSHSQIALPGLILADEQSLAEATNLWTHISGVPTNVNFDSLAAANVDRNHFVSPGTIQGTSISRTADQLASNLGLIAIPKENRYLELRSPEQTLREKLPKSVSFVGLIESEEEKKWLGEMLQELFPGTEDIWTFNESDLSYVDGQLDLMTWFEVVRTLETWRAARGIPASIEEYAPQNLQSSFVRQEDVAALTTKLDYISVQARPVGQVLSAICKQANIECWIDWAQVGSLGLGPSTTALVVTNDRTVQQALAEYADLFSLVVAIEDEKTLWVTSPQAYRRQARIYVLDKQRRTVEQWQQILRPLTPANDLGVRRVHVIATPDDRHIIVRCCRPTVTFP